MQPVFTFRLPDVGGTICAPLAADVSRPACMYGKDSLLESSTVSCPGSTSSSSPNKLLRLPCAANPSSAFLPLGSPMAPKPVPILMGCMMLLILTSPPVGIAALAASSACPGSFPAYVPRNARSLADTSGRVPDSGIVELFSGSVSTAPASS
jgi:hypothetical protein